MNRVIRNNCFDIVVNIVYLFEGRRHKEYYYVAVLCNIIPVHYYKQYFPKPPSIAKNTHFSQPLNNIINNPSWIPTPYQPHFPS